MVSNFDIQMRVKFCSKHKEFYDKKVRVGEKRYIDPNALVELIKEAETCVECIWGIIFGSE